MKTKIPVLVTYLCLIFISSCSTESLITETTPTPITPSQTEENSFKYLALGDSYTIGQSVCESCKFPEQLKKGLENSTPAKSYPLTVIAQTGWTTTNLLSVIDSQNPSSTYDLVTLLIGVNNQYQNKDFSLYEKEFPELVTKAIVFAKGDKTKVIVISIPDYGYTPYGQRTGNQTKISAEIDQYNAFAKKYCVDNTIEFINITDITREGLTNPNLVASDGLHPSQLAYSKFVERILPKVITAVKK